MITKKLSWLTLSPEIHLIAVIFIFYGCSLKQNPDDSEEMTREESLAADAVKMTPATDYFPPVLHSADFYDTVPMAGPINTAGIEDAPVITPDGSTFIFFFTPDGNIPAEDQLFDGVSGVWWCTWDGSSWTEPVRARLADPGELHLDGPFAVQGDTLWFGSARAGNYGDLDIWTAVLSKGTWTNWQNAGEQLNQDFDAGELYPTAGGKTLFFGAQSNSGNDLDIWHTVRQGESWSVPVNLGALVNTSGNEGQPFVSADGADLWFARVSGLGYGGPAVFRSRKSGDTWSTPEEIVSNYVGDPGLDAAGNLYFTHVFYDDEGHKIESDIYVAQRH